jgi:hypothetical protein
LASAVIAIIAVAVAVWQVGVNTKGVDRTNSLPVISGAFDEFRSEVFQDHLRNVWNNAPDEVPEGGFQALPDGWRSSAYIVAYFFEYLGVLVAYKLVPADFVIDFSANMIMRSWHVLDPFIRAERAYRRTHAAAGVSAGFVSHFEHLAARTLDEAGQPIDGVIQRRIGLRKLDRYH